MKCDGYELSNDIAEKEMEPNHELMLARDIFMNIASFRIREAGFDSKTIAEDADFALKAATIFSERVGAAERRGQP